MEKVRCGVVVEDCQCANMVHSVNESVLLIRIFKNKNSCSVCVHPWLYMFSWVQSFV